MSKSKKRKISKRLQAGAALGVALAGISATPAKVLADEVAGSSEAETNVVQPNTPANNNEVGPTTPLAQPTTPNEDLAKLNEAGGTAENNQAQPITEAPKVDEPKAEEPKAEEPKQDEAKPAETPTVPETGNSQPDVPRGDVTPTEPSKPEEPKPSISYTLDGQTGVATEGSQPLDLTTGDVKKLASELKNAENSSITYKQVLPDGSVVPVKEDNVLPINSQLVGVYKDKEGNDRELPVANISSTKEYTLETDYSEEDGRLGFLMEESQLLDGDFQRGTYQVLLNGQTLTTVTLEDRNVGGVADLADKLPEGTHTIFVEGNSRYGVKSVGSIVVNVKAKERPTVPDVPSPQPNPNVPKPLPNPQPDDSNSPVNPLNPSNGNSGAGGNVDNTGNTGTVDTGTITNPDTPPITGSATTPSIIDQIGQLLPKEEPKEEKPVVREAPKGIKDIVVGDTSLYGEQGNQPGVASNGESTTFTDAGKVDLRVSVDTSVVDTSRTVIKLVGRAQGELNSSDFVELRDGTYRLKGIAKDDYYTLTVKTYDRNGNLVSDINENFSINKNGSKYSIENKGVEGKSFKSLKGDLKILESNVDKIDTKKTTIKVYRNGKLVDINSKSIKISRSGGVDSNWKYTYSINKSNFKEDGVYTVEVFSQTETGVKYNSTKKTIQFTVDNTGAEISITGIRNGGRYKSNEKRITVDVRDISNLKSVKGFLNGKEVGLSFDEKTGLYYYDMKSSGQEKNDFSVEVEDEAGNVSTETIKGFLLSENLAFSIFNDDNLYYILGGIGAAAVAFFGFLALRRKRTLDEEDRLALEQAELLAASHSTGKERSTQVEEFAESGSDRISVEDVLPSSGKILSVATDDLDTSDASELVDEDSEATTVISTDEVSDSEDTDVLPDTDVVTDVLSEEKAEGEDFKATDVISEVEESVEAEDSKPTDVVSEEE